MRDAVDALVLQIPLGRTRAPVAQREVVLVRPALVGVAADPELHVRIGLQHSGLAVERRLVGLAHGGLVVIEVDHGSQIRRDGARALGSLSRHPLPLHALPLGAVIHRRGRRSRLGTGGGAGAGSSGARLAAAGNGERGGGQEHQQRRCAHHHSGIMGWEQEWSALGGATTTEAERRLASSAAAPGRFRCRGSRSGGGRFGRR